MFSNFQNLGGIAMTELRQKMIEALQLKGLSERTQEAYVRAVRQLMESGRKLSALGTLASGNKRRVLLPDSPESFALEKYIELYDAKFLTQSR
jgi:integrase-like protein